MDNRQHETETRLSPMRLIRLVGVVVTGGFLTIVGIVLLVVPGPGIPLVIGGLAILATEFSWAHRHLARLRSYARTVFGRSHQSRPDGDTE